MKEPLDDLLREIPFGQVSEGEADEEPTQALARRIRAVDLSHRSAIRADLRERLQKEQKIMSHTTIQKTAVAAALAILLGFAALVGPGRSFAEEIIGQLGGMIITSDDPDYPVDGFDPAAPTATPIDPTELNNAELDITSEEGPYLMASAQEVAEATGLETIYELRNVPYPFEGWHAFVSEDGAVRVDSIWSDAEPNFVSLTQYQNWPEYTVEAGRKAETQSLTVAGYEALLITNADLDLSDGRLFTILVIEAGADTLVLQSPSLDEETLITLAESLFE